MKKIKNNNKLISTNIVETVFPVPTAVGSYDDTRARTSTLTNLYAEAPFVAVKRGRAWSAAVVPWLPRLWWLLWYFKASSRVRREVKQMTLNVGFGLA